MLTNYGELEFCLAKCLEVVIGDANTAFRAMYRDRGEDRRINICDTLMRRHYQQLRLEQPFVETIDQVRYCKTIRNQYAHAWFSWSAVSVGWGAGPHPRQCTLLLVSLEDAVKSSAGIHAKPKKLPVALLEEQAAYFANARDWILWLGMNVEKASGNPIKLPKRPKRSRKPLKWVEP